MSGIPYQTAEKFLQTLQKVVNLKPDHISAYSLIVEEGTPFYEAYKSDLALQEAGKLTKTLPTEDEVYRITKLTQQYLEQAGYMQYEISNFAHPGCECMHNVGYWTRENYLGLGLGAASLLNNVRYTNTSNMTAYLNGELRVEECPVSRKEQMEEFMFLGLRMLRGVTRQQFQDTFGIPIDAIYRDVMEQLKAEGLLDLYGGRIALTEKGQELSNYALAQFLL